MAPSLLSRLQPFSIFPSFIRRISSGPPSTTNIVPFEPLNLSNETNPIFETPKTPKTPQVPKRAPPQRLDPSMFFDPPPAYPHGPALHYRQSNRGLYGGGKILFGNNVSSDHDTKTRRKWRLNVKHKSLHSNSLGQSLKLKVTTRVLRTIKKVGGLDEYLLGEKAARIRELGMEGWRLRWIIMQTAAVKKRYRKQMVEMGLAKPSEVARDPKRSGVQSSKRGLREGDGHGLLAEQEKSSDAAKFLGSGIHLIGDGRPEKE